MSLVLDLETTGLDVYADRVCEVGFILTDWKEVYCVLSSYVNPEMAFDNAHNGLNTAAVANAPTFNDLLPLTFLLLLRADEYVAHNTRFDLRFMREELARQGLSLPSRAVFDTLGAAHKLGLREACAKAGVFTDDVQWHSALGDATACYRLARVLRGDRPGVQESVREASLVPRFS